MNTNIRPAAAALESTLHSHDSEMKHSHSFCGENTSITTKNAGNVQGTGNSDHHHLLFTVPKIQLNGENPFLTGIVLRQN